MPSPNGRDKNPTSGVAFWMVLAFGLILAGTWFGGWSLIRLLAGLTFIAAIARFVWLRINSTVVTDGSSRIELRGENYFRIQHDDGRIEYRSLEKHENDFAGNAR